MSTILRQRTVPGPETITENLPLPALLQRILAARDLASPEQLDTRLSALIPPEQLKDSGRAAKLLAEAIITGQRLLVLGDFDADGATSSALAIQALTMMGAEQPAFLVPNRFEFGYGLTPEIVEVAARSQPDIIVTVDNGISSVEGVNRAGELGIRVIVTDHHLPAACLPAAAAIVNPNQPGCAFPSKHIAGVGVIFYLMLALRRELRERNWFQQKAILEPNLAELLDLVALGTVADVVTLDRNNRILVEQGLRRIRAGQARPGLLALLDIAGRHLPRVVSSDLAFAVGPRLNAAGRLDDMSVGIRCLLTDDPTEARELAMQLDDLNRDRRVIEATMQREAIALLEESPVFANTAQSVALAAWSLCL